MYYKFIRAVIGFITNPRQWLVTHKAKKKAKADMEWAKRTLDHGSAAHRIQHLILLLENYKEFGMLDGRGYAQMEVLMGEHWRRRGVCSIIEMMFPWWVQNTHHVFPQWLHFSGSSSYPVPHPTLNPHEAFHIVGDLWAGEYGEKRVALLKFVVEFIKNNTTEWGTKQYQSYMEQDEKTQQAAEAMGNMAASLAGVEPPVLPSGAGVVLYGNTAVLGEGNVLAQTYQQQVLTPGQKDLTWRNANVH